MNKYQLSEATRVYRYTHNGEPCHVTLRQLIALRDFADVSAGSPGGWVESPENLSQQGTCWVYDHNSVVFAGAKIRGNARVSQTCVIHHAAVISDDAWIDSAHISDGAHVSGRAMVQCSTVRGECHLFGEARVMQNSLVVGAKGPPMADSALRIYGNATVSASRVVHQAQIYGRALVTHAFIEHRAEVFENAILEGNADNDVWVCDCAKIHGNARLVAGVEENASPTVRYSSEVAGNALIEGDCLLGHHVRVDEHAVVTGGPVRLDNHVTITGRAHVRGEVMIEDSVTLHDDVVVAAPPGETIRLCGFKTLTGNAHILRTPLPGLA
ncbi:FIG005189: putative transferase clustered with tellurite resistance proteins TehA/TehB [Cronobacter condimenti 1330]|uniref:FIG005189: putative transferase clustered with tellurite resistance proteins TehA/TehB n=1 Tax=Cronobacter condimenti 1330 TaxID=1073999 RepID=K7ZZY1_9ENTR|nr:FIG005189: putative transferase clustered with tellurite resistance proteins TehA/TehB [Cronobacter condimenti 1330]